MGRNSIASDHWFCRRLAWIISASLAPLCLVMISLPAMASTHHVPNPHTTIQSAIDAAAPGDTVLVGAGTYDENLNTQGKRLVLLSELGAAATVIDGGFRSSVLIFSGGGIVEGFTIRHGRYEFGSGGIHVEGGASGIIRSNIIEENQAGLYVDAGRGGGIFLASTTHDVTVVGNLIRSNYAGDSGGGICDRGIGNRIRQNTISSNGCHVCGGGVVAGTEVSGNLILNNWSDSFGAGICVDASSRIEGNTVFRNHNWNWITQGAGIHISTWSASPIITNNLVVGNTGNGGSGAGILCSSQRGMIRLECNDSWNNDYADYVVLGSCDTTGGRNISLDPVFCDVEAEDLHIGASSPCAPSHSDGCDLIGALPVACGATQTHDKTTWGRVKAHYR